MSGKRMNVKKVFEGKWTSTETKRAVVNKMLAVIQKDAPKAKLEEYGINTSGPSKASDEKLYQILTNILKYYVHEDKTGTKQFGEIVEIFAGSEADRNTVVVDGEKVYITTNDTWSKKEETGAGDETGSGEEAGKQTEPKPAVPVTNPLNEPEYSPAGTPDKPQVDNYVKSDKRKKQENDRERKRKEREKKKKEREEESDTEEDKPLTDAERDKLIDVNSKNLVNKMNKLKYETGRVLPSVISKAIPEIMNNPYLSYVQKANAVNTIMEYTNSKPQKITDSEEKPPLIHGTFHHSSMIDQFKKVHGNIVMSTSKEKIPSTSNALKHFHNSKWKFH